MPSGLMNNYSFSYRNLSLPENCTGDYCFGFNGMESEGAVYGEGNSYTTEFRQYDGRIGRWLSLEPKPIASESEYAAFRNSPVYYSDPKGDWPGPPNYQKRAEKYGEWFLSMLTLSEYHHYEGGSYSIDGDEITFKAKLNHVNGSYIFEQSYKISAENFASNGRFARQLVGGAFKENIYERTPFLLMPDQDILDERAQFYEAFIGILTPPERADFNNDVLFAAAIVGYVADMSDFIPSGVGNISNLRGKSEKWLKNQKPKGWKIQGTVNPTTGNKSKGWVMLDEKGNERLRFMRPENDWKKRKYARQEGGYMRWNNERGDALDVDGKVVDPLDPDFEFKTHIPYSGPRK